MPLSKEILMKLFKSSRLIENQIDEFLQSHFDQYSLYFANRIEREDQADSITFTHLREDSQYDDLTILGIRKG